VQLAASDAGAGVNGPGLRTQSRQRRYRSTKPLLPVVNLIDNKLQCSIEELLYLLFPPEVKLKPKNKQRIKVLYVYVTINNI